MLWLVRTAAIEGPILGIAVSLLGFCLLALTSWLSPGARRAGPRVHWLVGWMVNGLGMIAIAVGWGLLAASGPRLDWSFLNLMGAVAGASGVALFVAGAARVGRLHAPSSYANELDTSGLYSFMRHPQALALTILSVAVGGLSRSVPYLLTIPLWILCWWGYARLEEKLELIPVFGERYREYCESTPCLFPALRSLIPSRTSAEESPDTFFEG
ncbi:MAG TPA: hypothetical protein VLK65_16465 [Vicinamibacteria bacterium]|nr:hypothetical protein [Vicinamibacteria bacterium]